MKFIPKQNKKARLLGQALSRSLNIDTAAANHAVAVMYGYGRWQTLCKAMQNSPASMWDEEVSTDEVDAREAILIERLSQCLQLDQESCQSLIQHLKPCSQAKSQPFSAAKRPLQDDQARTDDISAITEAFSAATNPHGGEAMLGNLLKKAIGAAGEETPDEFEFGNLGERMRLSKPVDPGAFFDILQSLGWPLDESSFEADYVLGEPSFFAESETGHVPVYLSSLAMTPGNDDDTMANEVMQRVEDDNFKNMGTERCILMWGQPQVKQIGGQDYSYWGRLWQDGQWRDFLINGDMTSADRLFDRNPAGQSINHPNPAQSDPDHELAASVVIFLQGLQQQREQVKMARINTLSGWEMLVPSLSATH